MRLGLSLAFAVVAALLALAGVVLLIWALYLFLGTLLSPPATALATGVITLTMAGALVWGAKQVSR